MRGWCIPAQGKAYEVKDKEAIEISCRKLKGASWYPTLKTNPAHSCCDPGNIVGYEYEEEEQPFVLQECFVTFKESIPVQNPITLCSFPYWEYKATWINYPEANRHRLEISAVGRQ